MDTMLAYIDNAHCDLGFWYLANLAIDRGGSYYYLAQH